MTTASSIAPAVAIIGALIAAVFLYSRARAEAPLPAAELLDPAPA
jgi:hypothetical protein